MNEQTAKERINQLCELIEKYNHQYYVLSKSIVSDQAYDTLLKELQDLENQYPKWVRKDSPTLRVGAVVENYAQPVQHPTKMYSLDNTYSKDELRRWHERVCKTLGVGDLQYVVELKIDGVSANLIYEDDYFALGVSRGDGFTGEDITENLRTIHAIPLRIDRTTNTFKFDRLEVRAEIYMTHQDLAKLNDKRETESKPVFANPRNATSGSLKLQNAAETAKRHLQCYVHSFGSSLPDQVFASHDEFMTFLKKHRFPVNSTTQICDGFDAVLNQCQALETLRSTLPYDVDGVVIKVNRFDYQIQLGHTMKSPRWAVAFKFEAYQAETTVLDIHVQVGRTGVLTPVAELEPVLCAGVMISRSTLHNFDEIERLQIGKGDRVLIERAGDVIPKIVKVVKHNKNRKKVQVFTTPKVCPECSQTVFKDKESDVAVRCVNPSCPKKLERGLLHFVSRSALDIEGMGSAIVQQCITKGLIHQFSDIYLLTRDDLLDLELFSDKRADNLIAAINKSKDCDLAQVIFGLGIPNVGEKAAQVISQHFQSIDAIMKADIEALEAIHDIGHVTAEAIRAFFQLPQTRDLINSFKKAGLVMKAPLAVMVSGQTLEGLTFVFTGELEKLTRQEAKQFVIKKGGKVSTSVSRKTNYLVVGGQPGSKANKAQQLGVTQINEDQFLEMINENT